MPGSRNPERNIFLDSTGALPSDSSLPVRYGAAYAAGLGCVYLEIRSFETGMGRRLVGHVRGSDTLGTVWRDEAFMAPLSLRRGILAGPGKKRYRDAAGRARRQGALLFAAPSP